MKRRAISPVFAVLLLVLAAVAIGLIVYAFSTGWVGGATKTAPAAQGMLALDHADAKEAGITFGANVYDFVAWIRNAGGIDEEIDKIYVEHPDGSVEEVASFASSGDGTLTPQEVEAFYFNSTAALQPGYVYTVRVVCPDGTQLTFAVRARA